MTTDSTASDDDTPPPLPAKTRESEYSNLSDRDSLGLSDYCSSIIMNNIVVSIIYCINFFYNIIYFYKIIDNFFFYIKPLPLINLEDVRPPTPPPKKPPMKAPI